MYYYAQLSEINICIGIFAYGEAVTADNMVPLEYVDRSVVGKRYLGEGRWAEVPRADQPLTEAEQIAITNALNIEYLVCLAESGLYKED